MKIKRHAKIDNWSLVKIPKEGKGLVFILHGYMTEHDFVKDQWAHSSEIVMINPKLKIAESMNTHFELGKPSPAFISRLRSLCLTMEDITFNNKESTDFKNNENLFKDSSTDNEVDSFLKENSDLIDDLGSD